MHTVCKSPEGLAIGCFKHRTVTGGEIYQKRNFEDFSSSLGIALAKEGNLVNGYNKFNIIIIIIIMFLKS